MPVLLDLFCGAGGAAVGYNRAGFEVVGVDVKPQPRYPFEFIQASAFDDGVWAIAGGVDAVHASPPCQAHSAPRTVHPARHYLDLVGATRELLLQIGKPWVIENVEGAPLDNPVTLCGSMFGLGAYGARGEWRELRRHRLFESSFPMMVPPCVHQHPVVGVYGHGPHHQRKPEERGVRGGYQASADEGREAMGIGWMDRDTLTQAIPPAYTEFVGLWMKDAVLRERVAA